MNMEHNHNEKQLRENHTSSHETTIEKYKDVNWNSSTSSKTYEDKFIPKVDLSKSLNLENTESKFHEDDTSIKIISTQSEPDLNKTDVSPDNKATSTDQNMHIIEHIVEKQCVSPRNFESNVTSNESHEKSDLIFVKPLPASFSKIKATDAVLAQSHSLATDDSFIILEKQVNKLCSAPREWHSNKNFNNTLECFEYILNNKPDKQIPNKMPLELTPDKPLRKSDPSILFPLKKIESERSNINIVPSLESESESSGPNTVYANDNFVITDKQTEKQGISPVNSESSDELNDTLDFVNYLLNYKPSTKTGDPLKELADKYADINLPTTGSFDETVFTLTEVSKISSVMPMGLEPRMSETKTLPNLESEIVPSDSKCATHLEIPNGNFSPKSNKDNFITLNQVEKINDLPGNSERIQKENFSIMKCNSPRLVTKPILSIKKPCPMTIKKTQNKYHYVTSPVATYIRNSPQVPLIKDVYPKKTLPMTPTTFKGDKNPQVNKHSNKKSTNLPSVAYKTAKKTKLIEIPDKNKIPPSKSDKQMASAPIIMKHECREVNLKEKQSECEQEASLLMPLNQAEVSVCTQKPAFKPNKH